MFNRLRLLPTVMLCAGLLLGLKVVHLVGGLESVIAISPARAAEHAATDKPSDAAEKGQKQAVVPAPPPVPSEPAMSPAEVAVLGSLSQRREELDKRAKDVEMREQLLAAAEKRVEERIGELKQIEASIKSRIADNDKANEARLAGVVKMYETMKPKDAARIFERLDMGVLLDVTKRMEPRKLAAVLATMDPVTAQELTVELATGDKLPDGTDAAPAVKDIKPSAEAPAQRPAQTPAPQAALPGAPAAAADAPSGKRV
ncbi:hypothetical protein [Parvibaculum sp.]|uniref:MotE family protein n=1 Tax=Parvibaculum sp. TaxID=2024848 RepID=UPI00320F52D5